MTTELEQEFFKVFGIEPKYIDGCKLSDKYFADEQLQKEYETFDDYMAFECPHQNEYCYSTCQYAYDCSEYPEITDRKLLEMIIIRATNYKNGTVIELEPDSNIEDLEYEVLRHFIDYRGNFDKYQIQQLFKEEE